MKSIWTNTAARFDPVGVGIVLGFVTPDCIRGYSNLCPSGTVLLASDRLFTNLNAGEASCS